MLRAALSILVSGLFSIVLFPSLILAQSTILLPIITGSSAKPKPPIWLSQINHYRRITGIPDIQPNPKLSENCREHARYMAVNNDLTHNQDMSKPYASANGQKCAQAGNAWLGSSFSHSFWKPEDAIDGWLESVGHRLWMLYPTTTEFGFGFFEHTNFRAAAGLDVLTGADFSKDATYSGWPVVYPADNQSEVPAKRYAITLSWPYFANSPTITTVSVNTSSGQNVAVQYDTLLPAGHKGIQIIPDQDFNRGESYRVRVQGDYDGSSFDLQWQFKTSTQ